MLLLLVESPSKCKKIESFLKDKYDNVKVLATCGHFREVTSIKSDFTIQYKVIYSKIKQIASVKREYDPEIILATDNDREGEAIAWHICDYFDLSVPNTKRILFNEITKKALLESLENPVRINMSIVEAQMARVICDRWIGYKFTPSLWNQFSKYKNVSAGRCQTPTLLLVKEREDEIKNGKHEFIFPTEMTTENKISLHLNKPLAPEFQKEKDDESNLEENDEYCHVTTFLKKSKNWQHKVVQIQKKDATRNSPPPFCTSSLQQYCSTTMGWSPTVTMKLAQTLYEKGCITYHRTESTVMATSFVESANKWIEEKFGKEYIKKDQKKSKPGAHECIRPTSVEKKKMEGAQEKKLYEAIWTRTIQSLMSACELEISTVKIDSPEYPKLFYEKPFENIKFSGFRILNEKENAASPKSIPFQENDLISFEKIMTKESIKKKILHYNEGQLVKLLDEKKIGRPSTFSSFVQKIQDREYVSKKNYESDTFLLKQWTLKGGKITKSTKKDKISEKQKIIMQDKGNEICAFLYQNYEMFFNYQYTAQMEEQLDTIADGKMNKNVFLLDLKQKLDNFEIPKSSKKNESLHNPIVYDLRTINNDLLIKPGKNGWSDYIFDKKTKKCTSLKNFKGDYLTCAETELQIFLQTN